MIFNDLEPQTIGDFRGFFLQFSALVHISRVNFAKMTGDKPGQPA